MLQQIVYVNWLGKTGEKNIWLKMEAVCAFYGLLMI